ncbi:hypothetical protein BACCAP_03208 [Pseudoflavonifractor capillosus ATCC 29799]|uniref:Uncharacterized protein n=1 Tax=Pseudoflavonifractor capillosus ATCC 29799 TaxID=411467 RepID=A6NYA9_9FIRM|nr:hypothetical protein [Pseudoflavonifractor capillosus]EDM99279.1 hypothetical protein BACCAP_03208 [Pseudoflavonifractor capillosus ATCC 29799]
MVYVASLSLLAKKSLGSKCHQSSINGILDTLSIDPAVSNMDVVLLGPADLSGPAGKKIPEAVAKRHSGVCVIYLCTNDREAKLFPDAPHIKQVKRIKDTVISEAVTEFYGEDVKANNPKYSSAADKVGALGTNPEPPRPIAPPVEETPAEAPAPVELELPEAQVEQPTVAENEPPKPSPAEDVIASVKSVKDWDILKRQINRDSIIRQLILENNEFAGVANMLNVWDLRIRDVWADPHKSNEEKMRAVQEFGANRQVLQATYNSVLVDKFVSLLERVVSVCSATVEERCNEITHAVISVQQNKDAFLEKAVSGEDSLDDTLYERMVELQSIEGELCKMFAFLHHEGMEEIVGRLGEKLPSTNEYINNVLSVSAKLYQPGNTVNLAQAIVDSLAKGQVQLSLIEDKVKGLMSTMFQVIVAQNKVIQYQRDVISCLRANNVESLVVRDSLLKECFNVIVGSEHTGLTATSAIYAGMLSRRDNTLVVDLTGHSHYDRYGYDTVSLDEFMVERIQRPLLFVTGSVDNDPEKVFHLMEELKSRLTYFRHLIIVLDAAQLNVIDQVGREALSISYVTNCTIESLAAVTAAYEAGRKIPNVCHKLICIDSPVDVGMLIATLKMDISMTKLIPIPYLREIKQAAIVRQQPHTYNDVLRVFEEAFRA